ncbi:MAG: class I SAM-dependent methyltransferase [Chloroflexota bacterium]|nr:class I SAM-dependent methyltransferase [Chloroflexota bacterium]
MPKPDHLGPEFGSQFADPSVVAAYGYRPPYPDEVLAALVDLVVAPGRVLDAGTGTGEIARGLAGRVAGVDALDPSPGMIAAGRALPGGDHPALTWLLGRAEDAPLGAPYGLITAASSLHWMEWEAVLPRFRDALSPGAVLAIVGQATSPNPWDAALQAVIDRYSTNRTYRPYHLVEELTQRGLFKELGRRSTEPVTFTQPVAEYVESFHARNGFSRDRMALDEATAFDAAVRSLVAPHVEAGSVTLTITGTVVRGMPAPAR